MEKLAGGFILGEWEGPQGSLFARGCSVGVRGRLWWEEGVPLVSSPGSQRIDIMFDSDVTKLTSATCCCPRGPACLCRPGRKTGELMTA